MLVRFLFGILAFMALSGSTTFFARRIYPISPYDNIWRQLVYRLVVMLVMGLEIGVCLAVLWVVYGI